MSQARVIDEQRDPRDAKIAALEDHLDAVVPALDRATRKVHNQRRELKRLNAKIREVMSEARIAEHDPPWSSTEIWHEWVKMRRRAQSAEAEVERLRGREMKP